MMMKNKILFLLFFSLMSKIVFCQKDYNYRREITGITETWHLVSLSNSIVGHLERYKRFRDMDDLRIVGFTEGGDTIEAPYILRRNTEELRAEDLDFKLLNQTYNERGFFYTFEIPTNHSINTIKLDFENRNFDWKIDLEGSTNQKEWFSILSNYRIMAIENEYTYYEFSTLHFPLAQYRFWRVCVKSALKPDFIKAQLNEVKKEGGKYEKVNIQNIDIQQDKRKKQTHIALNLGTISPASYLKIEIENKIDFVRPFSLHYTVDTTITPIYWETVFLNNLSSLEQNAFHFNTITAQKIVLTIDNQDNIPLKIGTISLKHNTPELIARFTEKAKYYLVYGNKNASQPHYDIENFQQNIPSNLSSVTLGKEETLIAASIFSEPFFKNKLALWGIMLIIIAGLGWQTLKMMKKY